MDICQSLICPCNGKLYKCLKAHQKTKAHQFWEKETSQKKINIDINRLEIENGHLRRLNILLLERIATLEQKV